MPPETSFSQRPIADIASTLGIASDHLEPYGSDKAKVRLEAIEAASKLKSPGKLILVSAITPTPAGEGKTTVSIGLAQGLRKIGENAVLALRQPSMGPVFGRKGGATGGGASRLEPSNQINLQFTGDFHAITAAHNLLAAAIDNRLHHGDTRLDPGQVVWKRALDMNDRALRKIVIGLGGPSQGVPRESGFDITAASEVMAILCLADSRHDLRARLDRILIGYDEKGKPVLAHEMKITGALMAILNEAICPNLVQSREGTPAFVHGGPFANIAHGCNSILATRLALAYGDYAVTEAGFAFDLGGEKFFDLKCRAGNLNPAAIVIVATVRALKMHGGLALDELTSPNPAAVEKGLDNLAAHLDSAKSFGKPTIVAINQFAADTAEELAVVHRFCEARGIASATANVFGQGGDGAKELAEKVKAAAALSAGLSPRLVRREKDRGDRPNDVRRGRRDHPPSGRSETQKGAPARLRFSPDLHGQDARLALRQPEATRPPPGIHCDGARCRTRRRGWIPRGLDRRDRQDAGSSRETRRRADRCR